MMAAGAVRAVGQRNEVVELCFGAQENGALLGEVLPAQRAFLAGAGRQVGFDAVLDRKITAVRMAAGRPGP